jgi:hypothetical protein
MRNLLALMGAVLVAFLGLGWYLNWYQITPKPASASGHRSIEIDINSKKIGQDVQHGVEAGTEKLHDLFDGDGKKPTSPAAASLPGGGRSR